MLVFRSDMIPKHSRCTEGRRLGTHNEVRNVLEYHGAGYLRFWGSKADLGFSLIAPIMY